MAAARIRYNEFSYPVSRLDILLDHLITVSKKYPSSFNRKEFTEMIGATPASNGPQSKLLDMIEFGLLSKNDQTYTITDLGNKVIQNVERTATIEKIIRKIPLWDQIFQRAGKKPTKDEFVTVFQQITHAETTIITRDSSRLWNSYISDLSCLTKTPPYSTRSAILGKQRIQKFPEKSPTPAPKEVPINSIDTASKEVELYQPPRDAMAPPPPPLAVPKSPKKIEDIYTKPEDLIFTNRGEITVKKLSFNSDGYTLEVKDEASYLLARVFLESKRKQFQGGE